MVVAYFIVSYTVTDFLPQTWTFSIKRHVLKIAVLSEKAVLKLGL
jgi:hypothetical protein